MLKKFFVGILTGFSVLGAAYQVEAAMTYDEALKYQKLYPNEIYVRNIKIKDAFGEKSNCRFFSLLKKEGVMHTGGSTIGGQGQRTLINFVINYGFENANSEPYAYIRWVADLDGSPEGNYAPEKMFITFEDGFVKSIELQGWEYHYQELVGWFSGMWCHNYSGRIKLNDVDIYDIYSHGKIAAVSIDDGIKGDNFNGIKHFFYSGDKDAEEKELLTKGFAHAVKILEIDPNTIEEKRIMFEKEVEKQRLEKMRKEIEQEIKEEMEREALKKQILEEMKSKNKI